VLRWLHGSGVEALPVHRLDRDTSGVMLFAVGTEAQRILTTQFEQREIRKTYQAIVRGRPAESTFTIDLPLTVDYRSAARVSKDGKQAVTNCIVLEVFRAYTLIQCVPVTGRHHQVRVHLASIGCPLAVDPVYGSKDPLTIYDIKQLRSSDRLVRTGALLRRTPLHALSIRLRHPETRDEMTFTAPLPADMRATLRQLRKWN
jgi:23S rRNA pseudouridine955/2504/2580 synthase/23S rRNA pseudouridine1911/1915/1917 synthase